MLEICLSGWVKPPHVSRHREASNTLYVLRGSEMWGAVETVSTPEMQQEGQADRKMAYPVLDTGSEGVRMSSCGLPMKRLLTDRTQPWLPWPRSRSKPRPLCPVFSRGVYQGPHSPLRK